MENEIIREMARLLEKTGVENIVSWESPVSGKQNALETALIQIKGLNARYERSEAIEQIQWLMERYNIQIDELMERIS